MGKQTYLSLVLVFGGILYFGVLWKEQTTAFQALYEAQEDNGDDKAWSLRSLPSKALASGREEISSVRNLFGSSEAQHPENQHAVGYRPPINSVLDANNTILADVQALVQFAVIGFGKCGTTTIISWLDQHPDLQTFDNEIYDLMFGKVGEMVRKMYTMPKGPYKRGYKSPGDLAFMNSVNAIRKYFPETKLIFGIRHPLLWFQSLYNFRVQNLNLNQDHDAFPKPNDLVGLCYKGRKNTCTQKGEFGMHIRNLGKTLAIHNRRDQRGKYEQTPFEQVLYRSSHETKPYTDIIQHALPNPVFLFEVNQLADTNTTRTSQFRQDMTNFMELSTPLPPMLHKKPGKQHGAAVQTIKDRFKIDICDLEHLPARKELMRIARGASLWLREYFLDKRVLETANVHVSSPDYLRSLLEQWMIDPCGDNQADDAGKEFLNVLEKDRQYRRQVEEGKDARIA